MLDFLGMPDVLSLTEKNKNKISVLKSTKKNANWLALGPTTYLGVIKKTLLTDFTAGIAPHLLSAMQKCYFLS